MGNGPSKFAGGDQAYLRDEQYRDDSRLARRADLHSRYGMSPVPWFQWITQHLELVAQATVLEVGCGAGWLWQQQPAVPVPPGIDLTLTDLSSGMVEQAIRSAMGTGTFDRVAGQAADLQSLPFADVSFDRVIANHMLYHLPDPAAGVRHLARVVRPDGLVVVATNGRLHIRELWEIRGRVFGIEALDHTIDVFGVETGFPVLRDHFGDVRWFAFADELRCTDPTDVIAYVCSTPPGEDATPDELRRLTAAVMECFDRGGGTMTITKDTGCFVCRRPITP